MGVVNFRSDSRIAPEHRELLREFCSELGGDPVQLANKLGLKVFSDPTMPDQESGYIDYSPSCGSESGYRIVVNGNHPSHRQRFTIAHEIGHFVLHKDTEVFRRKRNAEIYSFPSGFRARLPQLDDEFPVSLEREADAFAVMLLLPPGAVRRSAEFSNGEPVALARRLDMSVAFVTRRFEELHFEE